MNIALKKVAGELKVKVDNDDFSDNVTGILGKKISEVVTHSTGS